MEMRIFFFISQSQIIANFWLTCRAVLVIVLIKILTFTCEYRTKFYCNLSFTQKKSSETSLASSIAIIPSLKHTPPPNSVEIICKPAWVFVPNLPFAYAIHGLTIRPDVEIYTMKYYTTALELNRKSNVFRHLNITIYSN